MGNCNVDYVDEKNLDRVLSVQKKDSFTETDNILLNALNDMEKEKREFILQEEERIVLNGDFIKKTEDQIKLSRYFTNGRLNQIGIDKLLDRINKDENGLFIKAVPQPTIYGYFSTEIKKEERND